MCRLAAYYRKSDQLSTVGSLHGFDDVSDDKAKPFDTSISFGKV